MSYVEAKAKYAALGIDTDAAIAKLKNVPVSLHCWQGDDVRGFDTDPTKPLTGGIQTTGNYPGRARTPEELMADLDMVLKLCPGTKKMNLHASYAIFEDGWADRDALEPKHFKKWVDFCKERGLGCDFNPTFFSHPKANGLTLSSPDPEIRKFWIDHGKACIRISTYLAEELGQPCIMNIWTGDGFKDVPADIDTLENENSVNQFAFQVQIYASKDIVTKDGFVVAKAGDKLTNADGKAVAATAYIGVKGDANLNGVVEIADATKVLTYYAYIGASMDAALTADPTSDYEKLAFFLADVNIQGMTQEEADAAA